MRVDLELDENRIYGRFLFFTGNGSRGIEDFSMSLGGFGYVPIAGFSTNFDGFDSFDLMLPQIHTGGC